jgi:hypothetical protein
MVLPSRIDILPPLILNSPEETQCGQRSSEQPTCTNDYDGRGRSRRALFGG